jgi:hypothetical protein
MNKPKSSQFKFALTGTNCSGKTTLALGITESLKRASVLAEVVSSSDRRISWSDAHFPVDVRAHWGMITKLIGAEVAAELRGDADVVITDRSVLDLYAIATYDHPNNASMQALEPAILDWVSKYTAIYYLEPLPYQEDNKRPNDDFRMATHANLLTLFDKYNLPNVFKIPRKEVLHDIRAKMGLPTIDVLGEDQKWQAISNFSGAHLMVKERKTPKSDYDVWILDPTIARHDVVAKITDMFRAYWPESHWDSLDLMVAPKTVTDASPFNFKIFEPQNAN